MCTFCPGGVIDDSMITPILRLLGDGNATCGDLHFYIESGFEEQNSESCLYIQLVQEMCCPNTDGHGSVFGIKDTWNAANDTTADESSP